jgi:DMSO/TMAO reductase YedYZ molybdopterin-dependent catalytic subunit
MRTLFEMGERFTMGAQRLLLSHKPLVREYSTSDLSRDFPSNGTSMPVGNRYQTWVETNFRDWRLQVDGLVQRPLSLSLPQLRALPVRRQITQHSCDEGWSAIGQWAGVPLGHVLDAAGLLPQARFIIFHCSDRIRDKPYYESIDLFDAYHPQTILAYEMNGQPLPVKHGAPLRLRVELQIGYKNAKYVERIEVAERLDHVGGGQGGYWEDKGFQWYAGQ